jgi:hypothetical protein
MGGATALLFAGSALVSSPATAADDGFEPLRQDGGCAIAGRPPEHEAKAALRARCHWPDVDPEALLALVSDYPRYPSFV